MAVENQELYEFTQILAHSLKLIKMANELPEFVINKSRDINAEQVIKMLQSVENKKEILDEIASRATNSKISNDIDMENKKGLYNYIETIENGIERVKSPNFKLMADRFDAVNRLANEIHGLLADLVLAEQECQAKKEAQ